MNILRTAQCLGLLTPECRTSYVSLPDLRLFLLQKKILLKDKSLIFKKEFLSVIYFAYKLAPIILFFIDS
jgi:hypothetical protein